MANQDEILSSLRGQIDGIDEALHDLILQRATLVARIRDAKGSSDPVYFRPGREALILRRLLARHDGILPPGVVLRMWREMISAFVALQGPFAVAVSEGDDGAYWDIARDHFGSGVPMKRQATPRGVVQAVADGSATVGVLPLPSADDGSPWWPLLGSGPGGVQICARLPFLSGGNSRGGALNALVVAASQPEASGDDNSFLLIDCDATQSRGWLADAVRRSGFEPCTIFEAGGTAAGAGRVLYLIEVRGFYESGDSAFAALVDGSDFIASVRSVGASAVLPGLGWDGSPAKGEAQGEGGQ